jgi:hypothetical protein
MTVTMIGHEVTNYFLAKFCLNWKVLMCHNQNAVAFVHS